jgi:hypothetical protein
MKNWYVYVITLAGLLTTEAVSQNFEWAKREGLWAYDYGYGITHDNAGNIYAAGKFELQNANFSNTLIPCQGNHDVWVAQYSSTGNLNWIRTAGGQLGDYAHGIDCDNQSIYVGGEIEGTNMPITFVGSTVTLTCRSSNDAFAAKYDLNGNVLWAVSAGWYQDDKALSITHDNSGNVLICGFFSDTALFGSNTFLYGNGGEDIFVAKYDANGNFLWAKSAGGSQRDEAKSIKCDASGNVYITGLFQGTATFGAQNITAPNTYYDSFVAKYDANGNLQWVTQQGGPYDDVGWGMIIDNNGKIFITGEFNANATFGSYTIYTVGNADLFVACVDPSSGNIQWVKQAGGNLIDRARGIGTDGNNVYITGQFGDQITFGPSTLTAADSSDIFIAAMDNSGNFTWAASVTGPADSVETLGYESGNAVCAPSAGNVYATGSLLDGGTFGSTTYQKYGRTDVFITNVTEAGLHVADVKKPAQSLRLYPNPGNGSFVLDLGSEVRTGGDVTIVDCIGNVVTKRTISDTQTQFDLSEQQKGIYFMEMHGDGNATIRKKIVIQ